MSVILATAGYDHKIRFWEAPSGHNSRTLRFPESQVNCLEITHNKQYIAAGGTSNIRLFEVNDSLTSNQPVLTLEGHGSSVTSLGFQKEVEYLYSGSEDGTVKKWDLRSPTYARSFDCKAPVNSVALHPQRSEIISGDQNGSVKVWDVGTSKCINELFPDAHASPPKKNDSNSNSAPSSSSSYSSFGLSQRASIQAVDISEDGRTCVAADNHAHVFLWDATDSTDFKPLTKFQAHRIGSYLLKAKISPDSRQLCTCSSDQTARLFDISRNVDNGDDGGGCVDDNASFRPVLIQTLAQHTKWVWDAVFSADSSYLVTASSDHSARLWNLRTGDVVKQYTGHKYAVTCVALNDSST